MDKLVLGEPLRGKWPRAKAQRLALRNFFNFFDREKLISDSDSTTEVKGHTLRGGKWPGAKETKIYQRDFGATLYSRQRVSMASKKT